MLLTKIIKVTLGSGNIKHYKELGYNLPIHINSKGKESSYGEEIEVKVEDLPIHSNVKVLVKCDYCGKEVYKTYATYNKERMGKIKKDACKECGALKCGESRATEYKDIKEFIEQNECKLITSENDYINESSYICLECKCGNTFITKFIYFKFENKRQCNKCGIKMRSGENAPMWKGGLTSEYEKIRKSSEYKKWRNSVFKRDNYTCQCCGCNKGGNLQAHHIYNFNEYEDLRFDVDNGITLCENCHNPSIYGSFHYLYGTKHNTKEQLEEYIRNKRQ